MIPLAAAIALGLALFVFGMGLTALAAVIATLAIAAHVVP